ncbi:molybdopterin-dependent oxidoreductase [Streptomyces sp. NBC_00838]|uniref:molybdopterin-dependent oxidoreductase n=1 Tax=Streptomyces sp. NBC_00838 TaxID=2903680 RepID=UPI00386B2053|nr:molybdopterin-dependent oxidoreductase [Streptomyces sp. NBC_00838]
MDHPPRLSKRPAGARPALPTEPGFWRSPVRGVRFTAVLGLVLLAGLTLLFVTGLLSYAAYNPDLASVNDKTPDRGWLGFYLFDWPTHPYWLYRLTQGLHVTVGIALIPVLLAKLWSVIPRLFTLPPVTSLAHALERISLVLLVGGALFEFVTGVLNIQLDYLFPGSFYRLHFYGAWVFFGAFVAHAALKMPKALRAIRSGELRSVRGGELRSGGTGGGAGAAGVAGAGAHRAPRAEDDLASPAPAAPTVSRRGAFAVVGAGSLFMLLTTAGRSFDGPLRRTALLAPHGWEDPGGGPNGFQINKTAAAVGVRAADTAGDRWRLVVSGPAGDVRLSRAQLLAMTQHTSELPIACVEGWSTSNQSWRGVRLRDLAALAGYPADAPGVFVESLQPRGSFRSGALRENQVRDGRSLLALRVNGADLSLDHGFPARIIVPAAPGVLNTKWVTRLTFGAL